MTHNVVYLFPTPNLGNYQADMTISPFAVNLRKKSCFEHFSSHSWPYVQYVNLDKVLEGYYLIQMSPKQV